MLVRLGGKATFPRPESAHQKKQNHLFSLHYLTALLPGRTIKQPIKNIQLQQTHYSLIHPQLGARKVQAARRYRLASLQLPRNV